jgi:hypothetical protein
MFEINKVFIVNKNNSFVFARELDYKKSMPEIIVKIK